MTNPDPTATASDLPDPRVSRNATRHLAWIAPFVAIGIAVGLVYSSLPAEGTPIVLRAIDGSGIEPDSTQIKFHGVPVGIVRDLELDEDLNHVLIHAVLQEPAATAARKGTRFWIVRPEISLSGVEGLDTVVSGPYITFRPGDGPPQKHFDVLASRPPPHSEEPGLQLILRAPRAGSARAGTTIFYRDIAIGEVYATELASTGQYVKLRTHIEPPYVDIIRDNSVFWEISTLDFRVNVLRARLTLDSLRGLFTGGIAMATPQPPGDPVITGAEFAILEEPDDGEWITWSPELRIGAHPTGSDSNEPD
ncbi:MAG: MlaD family protein [Xanthomonadales bacterium]|nr:MlaD family protein [Xanthomonadales bacterium]